MGAHQNPRTYRYPYELLPCVGVVKRRYIGQGRLAVKRVLVITLLCLPIAAWALFKPVRVVAPELAGLPCADDRLCVDAPSMRERAQQLYDDALRFVDASVGLIHEKPRVIFCSTDACGQIFGLGRRSAFTVGTFGIVIGPCAWKPFYVRHEMIHYLQSERLGNIRAWREPKWFTEGMAYALSGDPRPKLSEPYQGFRSDFERWYAGIGREGLWRAARDL